MKKYIISEKQLGFLTNKLVTEAVGVPENILNAGKQLYEIVHEELTKISPGNKSSEFVVDEVDIEIGGIIFDMLKLTVNVEYYDQYSGPTIMTSMGMENEFNFDENILMQVNIKHKVIGLQITFITSKPDWTTEQLIESFESDKIQTISILSHELMHKYTRYQTPYELVGNTAEYGTYSSGRLNFGIKVIGDFMRYSYFIQRVENVVRPTEVASRMIQKGVTRDQFYDFIVNDDIYKELKEIRDFSFEYLIDELKKSMTSVDNLLNYAGLDISNLSDGEKIEQTLKLVYVNVVNLKLELFDNYITPQAERFARLFGLQTQGTKGRNEIIRKFNNYVSKYENKPIDFFKNECDRFNHVATNMMKKISKVYSLIPDEKQETNESILNWDLHQKLAEKKYGKRKIQTEINKKLR
jgi:hypothetical protein